MGCAGWVNCKRCPLQVEHFLERARQAGPFSLPKLANMALYLGRVSFTTNGFADHA